MLREGCSYDDEIYERHKDSERENKGNKKKSGWSKERMIVAIVVVVAFAYLATVAMEKGYIVSFDLLKGQFKAWYYNVTGMFTHSSGSVGPREPTEPTSDEPPDETTVTDESMRSYLFPTSIERDLTDSEIECFIEFWGDRAEEAVQIAINLIYMAKGFSTSDPELRTFYDSYNLQDMGYSMEEARFRCSPTEQRNIDRLAKYRDELAK